MKALTVKQLAAISGVTVRTLHHYDEIGLLKPAYVGENGYRYYERSQLLRLQQILFHREFGVPLNEIADLLDMEEADQVGILLRHRERLEVETKRYADLIRTIDRTIAGIKGETEMKNAELYEGFSAEKQAEYESWLVERYGERMKADIARSRRAMSKMNEAEQKAVMQDLHDIEQALAEGLRRGIDPASDATDGLIQRHRAWVAGAWDRECTAEAYSGLADLYLSHPDFVKRYETIEPGFAAYLTTAMKAHAAKT
ncbi:MAG TPA: MerR family transcriptional regulator [Hyphomonadaceae bacterium]|jgi:DNA-binding transcriptional MerR regulator|nr:MerR family transcriptional regulator [Hyphomonadaceae bacterium]